MCMNMQKGVLTILMVLCYSRHLQAGTQEIQKMVENIEKQMTELIDTMEEQGNDAKLDETENQGQIMNKLKRQQNNIALLKGILEKQEKILERQDKKINIIYQQVSEIGRMMIGFMGGRNSKITLDVIRVNPNLNPLSRVAALPWPGYGAFVVSHGQGRDQVIHMDGNGEIISSPYVNYHEFNPTRIISGLVLSGGKLHVLHKNGTIVRILVGDKLLNGSHNVDVGELQHTGSMGAELVSKPNDLLLLADKKRGEVFSYDLSKNKKTVHLKGLQEPVSVSYTHPKYESAYIVCEEGAGVVKTYNASWHHLKTIRPSQGEFVPRAAVISPHGTIFIADAANTVVSEFNIRGRFLQNVLTRQDGIEQPLAMSFSQGKLWMACNADTFSNVKSYRIYRE